MLSAPMFIGHNLRETNKKQPQNRHPRISFFKNVRLSWIPLAERRLKTRVPVRMLSL